MNIARRYSFHLFAIFIIFLCYSNTFHVPFVFDDIPNIVERSDLHIINFNFHNIINTFFYDDSLYRPVACLTFALNYYFNRLNVEGYHLLNLFIHIMTFFFLFKTIFILFRIKKYEKNYAYNIAFIASLLWAVHPIQIQAVTYIVQRMASLAGMFYILSLYGYLKFRVSKRNFKNLFLSVIFFVFAVLSKENAALLPLSFLLIELIFFNLIGRIKDNKKYCIAFLLLIVPILLGSLFGVHFLDLLSGNGTDRSFTVYQRVLTEFRIVVFYISQIFYPLPSRFSLEHYFLISKSLFNPVSTLFSLLFIFYLIFFACYSLKKYPFLSFAILFFFINHIVESTIIPLELVFEHRNYIPTFFLFIPLVQAVYRLVSKNKLKNLFFIFNAGICVFLMTSTYFRNQDWVDTGTFMKKTLNSAPELCRPYNNLGTYYKNSGKYDLALYIYKKGLDKFPVNRKWSKVFLYVQIANLYKKLDKPLEAKKYFIISINLLEKLDNNNDGIIKKNLSVLYYGLADITLKTDPTKALEYINISINYSETRQNILLKSKILILQDKFSDAFQKLKKFYYKNNNDPDAQFYLGNCLTMMGSLKKGKLFYQLSYSYFENNKELPIDLYIADNYYSQGQFKQYEVFLNKLLSKFSFNTILGMMANISDDNKNMFPLKNKNQIREDLSRTMMLKLSSYGKYKNYFPGIF